MEPAEHRPTYDMQRALELLGDKEQVMLDKVNAIDKKILMNAFREFDTVSFVSRDGMAVAYIGNLRIYVRKARLYTGYRMPPRPINPNTCVLVADYSTWDVRRGLVRTRKEAVSHSIEVSRFFVRDAEGWAKVTLRNDNLRYALEKQLQFEEEK